MIRSTCRIVAGLVVALFLLAPSALAQITTGTVMGRVVDPTGGVVAGAQVVLISEARGTRTAPVPTNESGDFVIPNVTADTYTIEVSAAAFKTTRRTGIMVSGGDRVGVPTLTLEVGGTTESVTVAAEAPIVQTQSGERSYAIETKQVEELPYARGNFVNVMAFVPGVNGLDTTSAGATRLGGASQNNLMMDGISAMDTGNNGQMLNMNIESIAEVKVLTQGYQAEYGRSSGLQVTAVTKSGSNSLHGSGYSILTNSNWNAKSWVQQTQGDVKPHTDLQIYGYTVGGPVYIPKIFNGKNKLFFFYAHEFRPETVLLQSTPIRLRLPTDLERKGNFSQSRDQNGNLIPVLNDYTTGQPIPGNVIPQTRLYAPGVAVLNQYPVPNVTQLSGMNYNWQIDPPSWSQLTQQPAVRIDYQMTTKLRLSAKYSGQRQRPVLQPGGAGGGIPGFSDAYVPHPFITNLGATIDYMINPTTFMEFSYGQIQNELAGGNNNGILTAAASNRQTTLGNFPLLYPNWGVMNTSYYGYKMMELTKPPFWDGKQLLLPPLFGWGSLIGAAPPNLRYPGWLNINRTRDFAINMTHIMAAHTIKAGGYLNHSYKAQNVQAGGVANLSFQGYVNFGNDSTNSLDSGFGYANAALGVFTQDLQQSKFVEGNLLYNQLEFFVQDTWKVNSRLTLDYGLRFVHQQPQYDNLLQASNFFPDKWTASQAPVLYKTGCKSGAATCSGNDRNALNPITGQVLTVAGMANTQAAIATPVAGVGNLLNGIVQAGNGISKYNYTWPTLVVGPRFGFAYDLSGKSEWVIRGGLGLFFDRPDGNTTFSAPANPPTATATDLRNGLLSTLGQGLVMQPVPTLVTYEYNAKIPSSLQWNVGVQRQFRGGIAADASYVGNHGWNRLGCFQGGCLQNQNMIDFGAAYLAKNQDPTLGTSTVPGANAYTANLLRPYPGLGGINMNAPDFQDTYHSMQFNLVRRFSKGFSFGANYTFGISLKGNTGLTYRYTNVNGVPTLRSDWQQYEDLMSNLMSQPPHVIKLNAVWSIPGRKDMGRVIQQLTSDWQISGVGTIQSGPAFDLSYSYQTNGTNAIITGSPDWGGRMVYLNPGAVGGGCDGTSNQYAQFNGLTSVVTGPTYGSLSLESGRNVLRGCWVKQMDLSLVRRIRLKERVTLEARADIFNALNTIMINGRVTQAQYNNPTSMTLVNNQFNADGSLNMARQYPRNAGFGAATSAMAMRNFQLQFRLQF